MPWEVEQKFRVDDHAAVERILATLGVSFGEALEQVDYYFNHPARDFAVTDEAFRLRQVGDENFVTYKGPKIDAATKTREEIELPLPPGRQIPEQYTRLLRALGFRPVATVQKIRREAAAQWENFEVHIALDDVRGVGRYIELEIAADDDNLAAAKSALASLARHLDLTDSERRSYLELLLGVNS